jgi:hypothetical protein
MATRSLLSNAKFPLFLLSSLAFLQACGGVATHPDQEQRSPDPATGSPSLTTGGSASGMASAIGVGGTTLTTDPGTGPAGTGSHPTDRAYPGTGFVVHEWGTNTVVVGSDGSLQRGLHHEGDDLPAFVYDRVKQANLLSIPSVDKMETPVDYFYSDQPLEAKVRVDLPGGVLTQWYPAVSSFAPAVLMGQTPDLIDPVFAVHYPYVTPACSAKYGAIAGGALDWGKIEVLAPGADVEQELPEAPLDRFTWSYARQVKANAIRANNPSTRTTNQLVVKGPQAERFLFYRGLGNFPSPVQVTAASGVNTTVRLTNAGRDAAGTVFVLNVGADRGAFRTESQGVAGGAMLDEVVPSLQEGKPMDDFVGELASAMTEALIATGLYTDESVGMVNTWRRQWFRTPGVRVLYFAPQAWIDTQVPLTIDPKPSTVVRVMVMRVEVLTPAVEQDDRAFAALLDRSDADFVTGSNHFTALGRFAEPRLRRALTNLGATPPRAATLLSQIEAPNASFAVGQ